MKYAKKVEKISPPPSLTLTESEIKDITGVTRQIKTEKREERKKEREAQKAETIKTDPPLEKENYKLILNDFLDTQLGGLMPSEDEVSRNRHNLVKGYVQDYIRNYGYSKWELDAIEPDQLSDMVEKAVEDELDMIQFEIDKQTELEEQAIIKKVRDPIVNYWDQMEEKRQ